MISDCDDGRLDAGEELPRLLEYRAQKKDGFKQKCGQNACHDPMRIGSVFLCV